jgi:hypothetical protein
MDHPTNLVTIHPYFKVHPGKLDAFKALLPAFLKKTAPEERNLFYEFTANGDEVFCREGYEGAEGLLTHLGNVKAELDQALAMAALVRLEVHGPAAELDKLRAPLSALKPAWFVRLCGVEK